MRHQMRLCPPSSSASAFVMQPVVHPPYTACNRIPQVISYGGTITVDGGAAAVDVGLVWV